MNATVFLGGGRITTALIAGLRQARYDRPIIVHDRHPQKLRKLKEDFRVAIEPDLARAVAEAGLLVIAVRPDSIRGLLKQLHDLLVGTQLAASAARRRPRQDSVLAVSLAAGIPLKQLRAHLGPSVRWARAMPSPVCTTANGLTGLAFSRHLPPADRRKIRAFFTRVGDVLELPENQFDAFSVTYSSSHGYHTLAALAESAMKIGLNRQAAYLAAAHALADGINYWRNSRLPLHQLLNEAATPGGVAATTMLATDQAGHRQTVEKGLRAGLARTRAYAKRS